MSFFKNNFWGEKNAGFDVLYHNMKHGQIATKELAEFVRERAAIEETYSKSMNKLAKMAGNGSSLGTFAPMWDLFRVSSDKLALCHLELMKKMNDLIRDISKYGEEQVKVHRKMKEATVGTVEAVQALQAQSGQLQKCRDGHVARRAELERLHREGAPRKELDKAELKSKKATATFASCLENYRRVGGDFELKMSESAQKFQEIEEAHLLQMKQLIKSYSHSIEDTHVQVGQVYEEFKQNVENIGTENLIQRFSDQKGTGRDRPTSVGFEEHGCNATSDGGKKSRGKSFRIPGLGKREKEAGSTDSAATEALQNSREVDEEGFVIRTDNRDGCSQEREANFYSSDSDFDDDEPKKFHIRIQPASSSNQSGSAAQELELRATVGALTMPPNRGMSVRRHQSRPASCVAEDWQKGVLHRDQTQDGVRRSVSSPDHSRLSSAASGTEMLFGPPLESAVADPAFSSESSSPDNVEDSGLDSPSHQPMGLSPEPNSWAAWPTALQSKGQAVPDRQTDVFLTTFGEPLTRGAHPERDTPGIWAQTPQPTQLPSDRDQSLFTFSPLGRSPGPLELDLPQWNCKHIPSEESFPGTQERVPSPGLRSSQDAETQPPPCLSQERRELQACRDFMNDTKTFLTTSFSQKDQLKNGEQGLPVLDSPEDPFSITMIGSPTHQSALASAADQWNDFSIRPPITSCSASTSSSACSSSSGSSFRPRKELMRWSSVHNPFSEGVSTGESGGTSGLRDRDRRHWASERAPRRNGPPLTRKSGPQEDLCFSADKEQSGLRLDSQANRPSDSSCSTGTPSACHRDNAELVLVAPPPSGRVRRTSGRLSACQTSRSVSSSPLPDPSPPVTSSSSSPSPSEWGSQLPNLGAHAPNQATLLPPLAGLSRGPSPISFSAQDAWPVAAAITEYISAYFKGAEHGRCVVKITGDFTMSFPAGIIRVFATNPNTSVLRFRLVNVAQISHLVPNQKLVYSQPSQADPQTRDFWFNMQALSLYLQREAELNPQAMYYNVGLVKYQMSSQDPSCAPLLLSAECQRGATVTRVSLEYRSSPGAAVAPVQLTDVQVLLPLERTARDVQCQPPASWNAVEGWLLWKLPSVCPSSHNQGAGRLCASWQCSELAQGPSPTLGVQFVGSGASLSGLDVELVGSRYRMSLVKKRFATGKYVVTACSL